MLIHNKLESKKKFYRQKVVLNEKKCIFAASKNEWGFSSSAGRAHPF